MAFIQDLKDWSIKVKPEEAANSTGRNIFGSTGRFALNQLAEFGIDGVTNLTGILAQDIPEGISLLGTKVYSTVTFLLEDTETLSASSEILRRIGLDNAVTYEDVAVTVTQKKNMTKTKVSGRQSTVKEFISNGEFDLSMSIRLATNYARVMPATQIRQIFQILSAQRIIQVSSRFLNFFNINRIVIDNWSMKQERGTVNTQLVSLRATSDTELVQIEKRTSRVR